MSKVYKLKAKLGDVVIEIEDELKIGGKPVSKIVMREPLVTDIELVNHIEDEIDNNATLVANLTGFTVDEVKGLPIHIFEALVEGLGSFQSSNGTK
ncbi:phage tail assembly protein [Arcobacter sp.]|uniref:phage tail assembly protein n=1 Tax=unclassified Arcobacter TaxID=2593671 RepID=UPI003B0010AA